MKRISYLGAGAWGFCMAHLLAVKGHDVIVWARNPELVDALNSGAEHPNLPGHGRPANMHLTADLSEAIEGVEMICEGVTSAGIRPVFSQLKNLGLPKCPIVMTSKGIEQNSGLLLTDAAVEIVGHREQFGCISGPSIANEVMKGLPTSVVCAAYETDVMHAIRDTFATPLFRVYPNSDINGVEFGGAMKNIMAIACGISDGLGFGDNTKAALMTRGLHEIRKLAHCKGCRPETLNGLAGMGDLCVTCLSKYSRNYRFGRLLAEGATPDEAKHKIGMVVEGAYTCVSALQLGEKYEIPLPISEVIFAIIYKGMQPKDAVRALMERVTKEEHL